MQPVVPTELATGRNADVTGKPCRPEHCLRPWDGLFPTVLTVRVRPLTVALGSLHPATTPPPWHDRLRVAQCAFWNVPQTNVNVPIGLTLVAIGLRREHASTRTESPRLQVREFLRGPPEPSPIVALSLVRPPSPPLALEGQNLTSPSLNFSNDHPLEKLLAVVVADAEPARILASATSLMEVAVHE